jgi:chemotaxis protein methyltransferase CheR
MSQSSVLQGISKNDAGIIAGILRNRAGIVLDGDKSYLIESRLMPLVRSRGYYSFAQLTQKLNSGNDAELIAQAIDALTTNETLFFRDLRPFEALQNRIIPELTKSRPPGGTLRIWSAAASTGQEAYSVAIMLAENPQLLGGCKVEIIGTDISRESLARAREGAYSHFEVQRGIPGHILPKYFRKKGERWQLDEVIRTKVSFKEFNLLDNPKPLGRFDVILCRNVLLYFDIPTKRGILERLAGVLADDGAIFLGGSESTMGVSERLIQDKALSYIYRLTSPAPINGAGRAK